MRKIARAVQSAIVSVAGMRFGISACSRLPRLQLSIGSSSMAAQLEGGIGAVEKLYSREQQLGVTNVLQVVDHELAFLEGELLDVAWLVDDVCHLAIIEMRAAVAASDRRPEVVEHVGVEAEALARLQPEAPDAHAI